MIRVVAFDAGLNLGYAALGGDVAVASGSYRLGGGARDMGTTMRNADRRIREVIGRERPGLIAFAAPFVGQVRVKGKLQPINPDNIRPLFGVLAKIEEVGAELRIACIELDEPECRRAFMTGVPRKSKDIKAAVIKACRQRGWPCTDEHAADALCVGAWALELRVPKSSHQTTPLFQAGN